jgi:hypothetical protein
VVPPAVVPPPPTPPVRLSLTVPSIGPQRLTSIRRSGLRVAAKVGGPSTVAFRLSLPKATAKLLHLGRGTSSFVLARASVKSTTSGTVRATLRFSKITVRRLRHKQVRATLDVTAVDPQGGSRKASVRITIKG